MMAPTKTTVLLFGLSLVVPAFGQTVYQCPQPGGGSIFQRGRCPPSEQTVTTTVERRTYRTTTVRDGGLRETEREMIYRNEPRSAYRGLDRAARDLERIQRMNAEPVTRQETRVRIERD